MYRSSSYGQTSMICVSVAAHQFCFYELLKTTMPKLKLKLSSNHLCCLVIDCPSAC